MKKGFGIIEILIAIAVLGFLYIALNILQKSNRESVIRIRTRDGAIAVTQEIIDSLSSVGVNSLQMPETEDKIILYKTREWKGTPGFLEHTMTVNYKVYLSYSNDTAYQVISPSLYASNTHTFAKKIDIEVEWLYNNTPQSITNSTIIR